MNIISLASGENEKKSMDSGRRGEGKSERKRRKNERGRGVN